MVQMLASRLGATWHMIQLLKNRMDAEGGVASSYRRSWPDLVAREQHALAELCGGLDWNSRGWYGCYRAGWMRIGRGGGRKLTLHLSAQCRAHILVLKLKKA